MSELTKPLGFHRISLDQVIMNEAVLVDLQEYVEIRFSSRWGLVKRKMEL